jgi:hypothetical protein
MVDKDHPYESGYLYELALHADDHKSLVLGAVRMIIHVTDSLSEHALVPVPQVAQNVSLAQRFLAGDVTALDEARTAQDEDSLDASDMWPVIWSHYRASVYLVRLVAAQYLAPFERAGILSFLTSFAGDALAAETGDTRISPSYVSAWHRERDWQTTCLESAVGQAEGISGGRLRNFALSGN